jgi:hypothetical protein
MDALQVLRSAVPLPLGANVLLVEHFPESLDLSRDPSSIQNVTVDSTPFSFQNQRWDDGALVLGTHELRSLRASVTVQLGFLDTSANVVRFVLEARENIRFADCYGGEPMAVRVVSVCPCRHFCSEWRMTLHLNGLVCEVIY